MEKGENTMLSDIQSVKDVKKSIVYAGTRNDDSMKYK